MKKNIFILLIVIAAALGVWSWQNKQAPAPSTPEDTTGLVVGKNAIYVSEQKPGNRVMIEFALLAQPGFVAIHENQSGNQGKILGVSSWLPAGKNQALNIPLSRATQDQETLFVMLHRDNGNGVFDPAADKPILENSDPVMMELLIDDGAAESGEINL